MPNATDINVIALVKRPERYVFLFDDASIDELLRTFGRFASNPELSFSFQDATFLGRKIRSTVDHVSRIW